VPTERFSLPEGDYALDAYGGIVIERKSKEDLWSTISQGRDRFEAELARIQEESEWSEVVVQPGFCNLNPKSLTRTIDAFMQRYPKVHWCWMPDRDHAEARTFWLLHRFWKDRNP
jgi:hypothetical protein